MESSVAMAVESCFMHLDWACHSINMQHQHHPWTHPISWLRNSTSESSLSSMDGK